jgi:hypothetical protein
MDSKLIIKYHVTDILGGEFETSSREEALASFEEGRLVSEIHEMTWRTQPQMSGRNTVCFEWLQESKGE